MWRSEPSQGADSYGTTVGVVEERGRIEKMPYVLTCDWCFLGAILTVVWRSRWLAVVGSSS